MSQNQDTQPARAVVFTMKKEVEKSDIQRRPTPQEVRNVLNGTNWEKYLENVDKRVAQEVDAFEVARARSLEAASHQVFL